MLSGTHGRRQRGSVLPLDFQTWCKYCT